MDVFKINVKLFTATDTFEPTEFVPIFHHWIQGQSLDGHLLIDVADYAHVPAGPGTLVVAEEANVHMDRTENRLGLLYVRKRPVAGASNPRDQIRAVVIETLKAAAKMEQEPEVQGRLKFRTDEISIRLNDRLNAPNTPATFDAAKADIEAVAKELSGGKAVTLENHNASDSQKLLDVHVNTGESASVSQLLERLGAHATG